MRYKEFVNENFKYLDPNMQGGLARSGDEDAIRELEELEHTLKTEYELPPLDFIG